MLATYSLSKGKTKLIKANETDWSGGPFLLLFRYVSLREKNVRIKSFQSLNKERNK